MKVAIPMNGEMLNAHFGQSKSFLIATIENNQVVDKKEVSTAAMQHDHGGLSGLLIEEGVSLAIVGGIGQPALTALTSKGLQVIRGAAGRLDEVLEKYLKGELQDQNVVCTAHDDHDHHHIH